MDELHLSLSQLSIKLWRSALCGIAGFIGKSRPNTNKVKAVLNSMYHRGPDSNGFQSRYFRDKHLLMMHTRLSIIDLDTRSDQPWIEGENILVFNGEIYNFIELRTTLIDRGYRFKTDSDTEVVAKALQCWGTKAFDYFEGMWALIWYDTHQKRLIISRDRFGEKPLYYLRLNDNFYFASELQALFLLSETQPEINDQQMFRYLVNGYKSLFKTNDEFYKNVYQIESGTFWVFEKDNAPSIHRYWDQVVEQNHNLSFEDAVQRVRERLIESVRIRSRSDVPLAYCMSGGVDSNAIISITSKILGLETHGFTIVNTDGRYDENELINSSVEHLGIKHTKIKLNKTNFLDNMQAIIRHRMQPIATITYYAHWTLMKAMNEHGYKVSFSGTAADELFSGYYEHHNLYLASIEADQPLYKKEKNAWKKNTGLHVRNPFLQDPDVFFKNPDFREHIYLDADLFSKFLRFDWSESFNEERYVEENMRNRMMNELFHEATPVLLREDDLNAMYFSIENRSPFLDRKLYEIAFSIPTKFLIRNGRGKAILRSALSGIVSPDILDEIKKVGFNAPILDLLDVNDKNTREFLLDESEIFNYIHKEKIEEIVGKDILKNSESKFLFNFLNAKLMYENQF